MSIEEELILITFLYILGYATSLFTIVIGDRLQYPLTTTFTDGGEWIMSAFSWIAVLSAWIVYMPELKYFVEKKLK